MAMRDFQVEILHLLEKGPKKQDKIIKGLHDLRESYDNTFFKRWCNARSGKGHRLIHELISLQLDDVLHYALQESLLDIEARRDCDGLTALQLAEKRGYQRMQDILIEHGACQTAEKVDATEWNLEHDREAELNIVWMDLELTALEEPEILECAVIITDKNLNKLDSDKWVIHYEQDALNQLGQWQQDTFKGTDQGGNGLFDDSIKSTLTKDQVEDLLLTMLKKYCPRGKCPLAGSSIQTDKAALKRCMPRVNDYLHYRIIDVTSFQGIIKRWAPWMESCIKTSLHQPGLEGVAHRAMNDIEWSIDYMRKFREFLPEHSSKIERRQRKQLNRAHSTSEISNKSDEKSFQFSANIHTSQLYADERCLLDRIELEQRINVKDLYLSKADSQLYHANPHLREIFLKRQRLIERENFTFENRLLPRDHSNYQLPGTLNEHEFSTTEHWGQRKLLLTDIEFLTKFANKGPYLVLYAGLAPTHYISYLTTLFPDIHFVLFGIPKSSIRSSDHITCYTESFCDNLAHHYSKKSEKLLFICNVRTAPTSNQIRSNLTMITSNSLDHDMGQQLKWYYILKPYMSLLSIRLSRELERFEYLSGTLIVEPWTARKSMECRMIVSNDAKLVQYSTTDLLNGLKHFQRVTRVMYYKHDLDAVQNEGLDHCYDCRTEIFILEQYLTCVQQLTVGIDIIKMIAKMSHDISIRIHDPSRPLFEGRIRTLDIISRR